MVLHAAPIAHIINELRINARPADGLTHGHAAQTGSIKILQASAKCPDRSTARTDNNYILHMHPLFIEVP
jgi:hypothetical protein